MPWRAIGASQNTAIVFTSDHGDMLGERGMWFKKHFFEPSLRVPLFLAGPSIKPQRVSELASLVDLLPTFCGLANGGDWKGAIEPLEGVDLTALLDQGNQSPRRTIFAEYLAEATLAPIFMIRRGRHKFISSSKDPALLFRPRGRPERARKPCRRPRPPRTNQEFRGRAAGQVAGG